MQKVILLFSGSVSPKMSHFNVGTVLIKGLLHDSQPIFRKTPADCGDKVENRSLFRKQNKRASEKFRYQVWSSAAQ